MSFFESIRMCGVVTQSQKLNKLEPITLFVTDHVTLQNPKETDIATFVINEVFAFIRRENPDLPVKNIKNAVTRLEPHLHGYSVRKGIFGVLAGLIYCIMDFARGFFTGISDKKEAMKLIKEAMDYPTREILANQLIVPVDLKPKGAKEINYGLILSYMRNYYHAALVHC